MKTGHSWKEGFGVFGVVGMIILSMLVIPTEIEAQSEWVQTTQADFDSAITKWNVDTTSNPGNVSLVPSSTDWVKGQANPIVDVGAPESWREISARSPEVVWDGSRFHMWFYVCDGPSCSGYQNGTAHATSADGYHWAVRETGPVLMPGTPGEWDESCAVASSVRYSGGQYHMWYTGCAGDNPSIVEQRAGYAFSDDGTSWTRPDLGVISYGGSTSNNIVMEETQPWESGYGIRYSTVVPDGGIYHMWYVSGSPSQIGYANSTDGFNWIKYAGNPVVQPGLSGGWDGAHVTTPHVLLEGGVYKMWYAGESGTADHQIGYAESPDGVTWTSMFTSPVMPRGSPGEWDNRLIVSPCVLFDQQLSRYRMWFEGMETGTPPSRIGHAVSSDEWNWTKRAVNPVVDLGLPGEWDDSDTAVGSVIKEGDVYRMWYHGRTGSSWRIGHAQSDDGLHWFKHPSNPVLDQGSPGSWDSVEVSDPYVIKDGDTYMMWYSGHDGSFDTFRIGYAESVDGIVWVKNATPVLGPGPGAWESLGVALPSVMKEGGAYKMWYSGYDGTSFRTGYAESPDGLNWTKHGGNPVLGLGSQGSWEDTRVYDMSVFRSTNLYEMLYSGLGSGGYRIGYASSPDGTNWTKHRENPILHKGPSAWDSGAVTGPFVLKDGNMLRLWYHGSGTSWRIGAATSAFSSRFVKQISNPVLEPGHVGYWEGGSADSPSVLKEGGTYKMWYLSNGKVGLAASVDGYEWTKCLCNPVFEGGPPGSWEEIIAPLTVIEDGGEYKMWYSGFQGGAYTSIGYAHSPDGISWTRNASNPVLVPGPGSWDFREVKFPVVLKNGSQYMMWYTGVANDSIHRILYANSTDGVSWSKYPNPILEADFGTWEDSWLWEPWVISDNGSYMMIYSGGNGWNARLGLATSPDGITWNKYARNPILDWGPGGSWDAEGVIGGSFIKEDGLYRRWSGGFSGDIVDPKKRIGHALSLDGFNWTKRAVNPVLTPATGSNWDNYSRWAPSVLFDGNDFTMYFGGNNADGAPTSIGLATSVSGHDWTPMALQVLPRGNPGEWDAEDVTTPSVLVRNGTYEMYYTGDDSPAPSIVAIGRATSSDGLTWNKNPQPILSNGSAGEWDDLAVGSPAIFYDEIGQEYLLYYAGHDNTLVDRIGLAISTDGNTWTKHPDVVLDRGPTGSWDSYAMQPDAVIREGPVLWMFYTGYAGLGERGRIGLASSIDGINWTKSALNPILDHGSDGRWDRLEVERSSVIRVGEEFLMYYHSETGNGSSIGSAASHSVGTGTLVSVPFDPGISGRGFENLSWSSIEPSSTLISFAYRTSEDNLTWSGWSEEWRSSPVDLSSLGSTARWIQWRATLVSLDGRYTPILSDVTVSYESNTATAPDLVSPLDGSWTNDSTPTFSWTFNDLEGDNQSAFVVEIDDDAFFGSIDLSSGTIASSAENWTAPSAIADGCWFWRARTRDSFSLWSENSTNRSFCVDTTAPITNLSIGMPSHTIVSITYITGATAISMSFLDNASGVNGSGVASTWFRIDGSAWTQYANPFNLSGYSGLHTISFNSTDNVMNHGAPQSVSLHVDDIPPATAIQVGSPSVMHDGTLYVNSSTGFNITATDEGSGMHSVWYRIDSDVWTQYDANFTLFVEGPQVVHYNGTDNLLNHEQTENISVFVDNTPPVANAGIDQQVYMGTTLVLNATLSTDNSAIVNYTWSFDSTTLYGTTPSHMFDDSGSYLIDLTVTDVMGYRGTDAVWVNVTALSAPQNLQVEPGDTGELRLTWDSNPEPQVVGYNVYRSNESGGTYAQINANLVPHTHYNDTGLLDETTYYYFVRAVDANGTESPNSSEESGTTIPQEEPPPKGFLEEYWWIVLLIILFIALAIVILIARRKKPAEQEVSEEADEEETMDTGVRDLEMTDEERLEKLERRYREGEIPEDIYAELKERYGREPDSRVGGP